MPRLFTALQVPQTVAHELSRLRGGLPGARWIDVENYHITLRFIGHVEGHVARDIAAVLDDVSAADFDIDLDGLDSFGGKKPHSIYAKVVKSEALMTLQADIERAVKRIGLPPETRKFTPHLTLARLKGASASDVATYLSQNGGFQAMSFTAERFVLYSSRASRGGGPYIVEADYPFDNVDDYAGIYDEYEDAAGPLENEFRF